MKKSFDILIVGVGGQGTILTSNVLGEACLAEDRAVKGAEVHGMAQRGGSVESHVRIDGGYGPIVTPGCADLVIALEMLEALRYRHYLAPSGTMIVNTELVVPTSVFVQKLPVPMKEDLAGQLKGTGAYLLDANAIAVEAGSILAQNIVMLGASSQYLPLAIESLLEAVKRCVPKKTIEINLRAFQMGRDALSRTQEE